MLKSSMFFNFDKNYKSYMFDKFNYTNVMQIPHIEKIVVNMGVGRAINDSKILDYCFNEMAVITAQNPIKTYSKKSISNFKLREGVAIGCKVTLRKVFMLNFLYKLINVVIPRIKDFKGLSLKSFDGYGNYSFGISDYTVFPEIDSNKVSNTIGLDIAIVTTATSDNVCFHMLKYLGFPFMKGKM